MTPEQIEVADRVKLSREAIKRRLRDVFKNCPACLPDVGYGLLPGFDWQRDALADLIESGEFTADEIATGIIFLLDEMLNSVVE